MSSNKGQYGPESLRLKGMSVDELPIAEARVTLDQLPLVAAMDKQNKAEGIKARYPKQTIEWVDGALRECKANLINVRDLSKRAQREIDEYMGLNALCKHRNKLLKNETDTEKVKQINAQFPPYNVKAMKAQIGQFKQTINRCNDVMDKEQESIQMLSQLRVKCVERDEKLKMLGVTIH